MPSMTVIVPVRVTVRWRKGRRELTAPGVERNERENAREWVKNAVEGADLLTEGDGLCDGSETDPSSASVSVGRAKVDRVRA